MNQADIKRQLPSHLRQFVADQDYASRYTAKDHAVWRFVMGQLVRQLEKSAHPVYFDGLQRTGISLDAVPSIDGMNESLAKLGWQAIVVDGFIPPQAFMELQSLRILAIAVNMRSIHHIEYTPAPDIIHEAAGHAPIIADVEYSDYLQRFGEVGMKAIYNQYDLDLYQAVRQLSIVKASFDSTLDAIHQAEETLGDLVRNPGQPSELALLTRLHWWTVEYGLVGDTSDYSIFGAGLLSSLSESLACMDKENVKKLPLTVDAIKTPYDITTLQPQLFVTKSCRHLTQILNEYATTMCYQTGGVRGVETAIEAGVVTTCQLSSGVTISGKFSRALKNSIDEVIYINTEGPTQLAFEGSELDGHGTEFHVAGFGSPVGRLCNLMKPLEHASEYELQELGIRRGELTELDFLSGVIVKGQLKSIHKANGVVLLMSFRDCTVLDPGGEILFDPSWGTFDMVVGESIASAFAGSADPTRFDVYPHASASTFLTSREDPKELALFQQIQTLREERRNAQQTVEQVLDSFPENWLMMAELLALLPKGSKDFQLLIRQLKQLKNQHPDLASLISRALAIYNK